MAPAGGLSANLNHEVRSLLWADDYLQAVKRVIESEGLALHTAVPAVDAVWAQGCQLVSENNLQRARYFILSGRRAEAVNCISESASLDRSECAAFIEDLAVGVKVRLSVADVSAVIPLITAGPLIRAVDFVRSRSNVGARDAMFSLGVIILGSDNFPDPPPFSIKPLQIMRPVHARLRQEPVLSGEVRAKIEADFASEDWPAACRLLDLYGQESTDAGRTRVQLAVLKLAGGDSQKLTDRISDALRDYCDVLVWANG